jgi:uncharacterized membrane protein
MISRDNCARRCSAPYKSRRKSPAIDSAKRGLLLLLLLGLLLLLILGLILLLLILGLLLLLLILGLLLLTLLASHSFVPEEVPGFCFERRRRLGRADPRNKAAIRKPWTMLLLL